MATMAPRSLILFLFAILLPCLVSCGSSSDSTDSVHYPIHLYAERDFGDTELTGLRQLGPNTFEATFKRASTLGSPFTVTADIGPGTTTSVARVFVTSSNGFSFTVERSEYTYTKPWIRFKWLYDDAFFYSTTFPSSNG